jgi:transcriptional regulator with XRE-family HTH domain
MSTIAKQRRAGPGAAFAVTLGAVIREERRRSSLSQAALGGSLSRAFVSQLEQGKLVPSLGSLLLIADRLGLTAADILCVVTSRLRETSAEVHADDSPKKPRGS